jgi:hypothetical protein
MVSKQKMKMFREYNTNTMGFFSLFRCCNYQRCMICTEKQQDCLTFPCCNNNYIVCKTCASNDNLRKCPQCREPFKLEKTMTMVKTMNVKWFLIGNILLFCSSVVLYGFGMNDMAHAMYECDDGRIAGVHSCKADCSGSRTCERECSRPCNSEIADMIVASILFGIFVLCISIHRSCEKHHDRFEAYLHLSSMIIFNLMIIVYFATSSVRETPNVHTLYVSFWVEILYLFGGALVTAIVYGIFYWIVNCFPQFKQNNCCYEISEVPQSNVKITMCEKQQSYQNNNAITPDVQKCDV